MNIAESVMLFIIAALAGLGLILLSTRLLSEGLQVLMSRWIRQIVNLIGKNSLISLSAGGLTSLMIQSRTSASIMAVSFTGSGLMNLPQLLLFLTGAGIGTLLTVWIFAFESGRLDLYFLALGVIPMLHARRDRLAGLGRVIFALGLMLLGYDIILFGASDPELISSLFMAWIPSSVSDPLHYWGLIFLAVFFNVIVRSTVALMALVMAFTATQFLSLDVGMVLVFGINLGATLPVLLAARRSNLKARQGSFVCFLNHFILILMFMPFVNVIFSSISAMSGQVEDFAGPVASMNTQIFFIPLVHLVYNFVAIVFALALNPLHLRWIAKIYSRPAKKERQQLKFLGRPSHLAPSLAIEQASQEVKKMAAMVQSMLNMTRQVFESEEKQTELRVKKYENITDRLLAELSIFITKVMQSSLTKKQSLEAAYLLQMAVELEGVADCCETVLKFKSATNSDEGLLSQIQRYLESAIEPFEYIFPLLTETISIDDDSMQRHEEKLKTLVKKSHSQFNDLIRSNSSDKYTNSVIECMESIHRIAEHSRSMLDARTIFI